MGFVVDFHVPALENMTQTKTRVYGLNVSTQRAELLHVISPNLATFRGAPVR